MNLSPLICTLLNLLIGSVIGFLIVIVPIALVIWIIFAIGDWRLKKDLREKERIAEQLLNIKRRDPRDASQRYQISETLHSAKVFKRVWMDGCRANVADDCLE